MTPWTAHVEELMTRPHEMTHRPNCPESGTTRSRVGSWQIERCRDCKATSVRKADDDHPTQEDPR